MILFNLCRCLGEDATSTSIKERRDIEIQSAHESVSNVPDYSQCSGHKCYDRHDFVVHLTRPTFTYMTPFRTTDNTKSEKVESNL